MQPATQRLGRREAYFPYLLVVPALLMIGAFILYPMLSGATLSLYDTRSFNPKPDDFIGLGNYSKLLADGRFLSSLGKTLIYVVFGVAGSVGLGLIVAMLLNQKFNGRALVRAIVTMPWATPLISSLLIWFWMFDYQYGVINFALGAMGGQPVLWLNDPNTAMASVVAVDIWQNFPFVALVLLTALQTVDETLYDAARVDGAGSLIIFHAITLPSIRPTLGILTLLLTVWLLRRFETIWILTQGGPNGATDVIVTNVYRQAFQLHRPGYAAATAMVGLLISLAVTVVYFWRENRRG